MKFARSVVGAAQDPKRALTRWLVRPVLVQISASRLAGRKAGSGVARGCAHFSTTPRFLDRQQWFVKWQ